MSMSSSSSAANAKDQIESLLNAPEQLQQLCDDLQIGPPEYEYGSVCRRYGVRIVYEVKVIVGECEFVGRGWSKRFAKCQAALKALKQYEAMNSGNSKIGAADYNSPEVKTEAEEGQTSSETDSCDNVEIPPGYDDQVGMVAKADQPRRSSLNLKKDVGKWVRSRMETFAIMVKQ